MDLDKRLALALEASGLGIWDWDLTTNAMNWSEKAKAIAGFPLDQPVSFDQVRDSTHAEDYPRTSAMAARSLDPQVRARDPYEYRLVRPDGSIRWVLAHGAAVFETVNGIERAVRYTGTIQDISQRHEAEVELREQSTRLQLALDAAHLGVWDFDIVTNSLRGSAILNRILGYADNAVLSVEEIRGNYHPEDRVKVRLVAEEALARGESQFQTEYRYLQPKTSLMHWHLVRAEVLFSPERKPQRVLGVVMDITERKTGEATLEVERKRLALALKAANAGAWELNVPGELIWDRTFYDVLGLDPSTNHASGDLFVSRLHPDDQDRARAEHRITDSGIPPVASVEYRFLRPGGTWGWIESQRVSRKVDGKLQTLGVTQDITRRKETEERLTALLRELSHRVKNQFAIVLATVRAVEQNASDADEVRAAISGRVHALARAHDLLVEQNWGAVGLREILLGQLEAFGVESFDIDGQPVRIAASAVQYLAMAFFELATNAAKYGALSIPKERVSVRWQTSKSKAGKETLELEWREISRRRDAIGRKGFGSRVLEQIAPAAMAGKAYIEMTDDTFLWRLSGVDIVPEVVNGRAL